MATIQQFPNRQMKVADVAAVINGTVIALVDGGFMGTPVHYGASELSIVAPTATNLATALALVNNTRDVWAGDSSNEINPGHYGDTVAHKIADGVNVTSSPKGSASDSDGGLSKSCTLANEMRADYLAHRSQAGVHVTTDSGNAITALVAKSKGTIVCDTAANHASGDTVTVNDGINPALVYEFRKSGSAGAGHVAVDISGATTAAQVATALKTAIDASISGNVLAATSSISTATITLVETGTTTDLVLAKVSSSALAVATTTRLALLIALANDTKTQINAHVAASSGAPMIRVVPL